MVRHSVRDDRGRRPNRRLNPCRGDVLVCRLARPCACGHAGIEHFRGRFSGARSRVDAPGESWMKCYLCGGAGDHRVNCPSYKIHAKPATVSEQIAELDAELEIALGGVP